MALPRNLLSGFCSIEPLVQWARDNPAALPDDDSWNGAFNLVVAHHSKLLFADLGLAFDELARWLLFIVALQLCIL